MDLADFVGLEAFFLAAHPGFAQLPLADLLRQSVYSRMAGYEDVNDAARLAHDPTLRLIRSKKIWERGATLTSRLQSSSVFVKQELLGAGCWLLHP